MSATVKDCDNIKRPPFFLAAMEMFRAGLEGLNLLMSSPELAQASRGDGHPVMVLPGFGTGDDATALLRGFLETLQYEVHPWRLGMNLDHRTAGHRGEHIAREIDQVRRSTGRKVSLVGWSLGGVIAREAARRDPQSVRQVICIASPFSGNPNANHGGTLYEMLSGNRVDSAVELRRFAVGPTPLPMPSTAIYSRTDGITAWENCLSQTDHQTENIEVESSHFGMVLNTAVFRIVADRLSQPEEFWKPYQR